MSEFEATLRHGAFILFGGLSGALLATYFIARRFQRSICDPIESLSSSAKTIANTADFSQRTKVHAEDEIGQLAMNFNHMLTELQKRDAELRCNQTRFRTLIDEAMDAILIIQQNGIVVDFNPMAVSCLRDSRTGLLHRNISEIIPEFSPEKFQDLWRTTFAGTHPILKTDMLRKDHSSGPVEIKLVAASQASGDLLIAFCRDVTERLKLEEQLKVTEENLRQSQKMDSIGQLAGGIAHDFNNMLAGIVSSAELLKILAESDQSLRYTGFILSAAKQASDLTEKLLNFSRKGVMSPVPFDINATVRGAIAILERTIDPRIQIIENYGSNPDPVSGDAALIQNVVLNLAFNARDAMHSEGVLSVTTGRSTLSEKDCHGIPFKIAPGDHAFITVQDTGCGISKAQQQKIFEPKDLGTGSGMGLSSVYGTIQSHHGAVLVESEEGKGTTFTILLPVTNKMPNSETANQSITASRSGTGCILLVDDDEIIRTIVPEMLEEIGYMTITAKNGEEGIRKFLDNEENIELVILDMVMPLMDGATCFSGLRRINPDIKVIASSGSAQHTSTHMLKEEGFSGLIKKPFDFNTLKEVISEVAGSQIEPQSSTYRPNLRA